jgi:predicted ATPase
MSQRLGEESPCRCKEATHDARLVVVTGGPGAGKTALLELVRGHFCAHVAVLPEAAGIVFGGGFPRRATDLGRRAGQRAILHVQREMEGLVKAEQRAALVLCDRGTLDGLAYWPGPPDELLEAIASSRESELSRYAAVLHLRTPPLSSYNHRNPLRTESAAEAAAIDERIAAAWRGHPRLHQVDHAPRFLQKVARALELIRQEIPSCCRGLQVS